MRGRHASLFSFSLSLLVSFPFSLEGFMRRITDSHMHYDWRFLWVLFFSPPLKMRESGLFALEAHYMPIF